MSERSQIITVTLFSQFIATGDLHEVNGMKAFKLTEWGQPGQYVEVPKPAPGPNDILVRMKAAGLCATDTHMLDSLPGSSPHADSLDAGFILGHENAGHVAALGSAVEGFQLGEAVVIHHMRHCDNCEFCCGGAEQLCSAHKSPKGALWITRGVGSYVLTYL